MANIYKVCKQCGSNFYITDKDQNFFNEKGLELPKRCFTCRKQNKRAQESAMHEQTWGSANPDLELMKKDVPFDSEEYKKY